MHVSRIFHKRACALTSLVLLICVFTSAYALGAFDIAKRPAHTLSASYSQQPGSRSGVQPSLNTLDGIHPFLMSDYLIKDLKKWAPRFDFVWQANVDTYHILRNNNAHMFLTYYMPYSVANGNFRRNNGNHSLAYWKSAHPDWILYKCDRVTPAYLYNDNLVPFDFTNPAVIAWQMQKYVIPAMNYGYDGIAADNIDFGNWYQGCGIYRNGQWVQLYTGQASDPNWQAGVLNWLTQMHNALSKLKRPLALIPNLAPSGLPLDGSIIQQVVRLTDGLLDEGGFTTWGAKYLSDNDWVQRVLFMEYVQQQNKPYYLVNSFSSLNRAAMQWSLSSYLMGKEASAEIFTSTIQGYGNVNWFQEYNAAIGVPNGAMYQSQNIYWRAYSKGLVLNNPSAKSTYQVTLDPNVHYVDLYGNPVGPTLSLAPTSGIVLLVKP